MIDRLRPMYQKTGPVVQIQSTCCVQQTNQRQMVNGFIQFYFILLCVKCYLCYFNCCILESKRRMAVD